MKTKICPSSTMTIPEAAFRCPNCWRVQHKWNPSALLWAILVFCVIFMASKGCAADFVPGAKLYIGPLDDGFEAFVRAAFLKKHAPLDVVTDENTADFALRGSGRSTKYPWIKPVRIEEFSAYIVETKTGRQVFAYSVTKHLKQKAAEVIAEQIAKQLKAGKLK